jgi:ubiquinone/menaquinone biosynthesis C-methylase UbiE
VSVAEMDIKQKQEAYHDWEASNYDDKFSISYDQRCIDYAIARFRKVIPEGRTFDKVLEIGAGTGFFLINLWQGGAIGDDIHATDISTGMLSVCERNAAAAGLHVTTKQGDAESLPYPDDEFDLVIGHAFLHHLPEPEKAIGEMFRVLKPGGELIVAGEPTLWGDRIATVFKRGAYKTFRTVTRLPGLRDLRRPDTRDERDDTDAAVAALEDEVDLHTFRPEDVEEMARGVGFDEVEVVTEELTGNWMGWTARTIEASARPGLVGMRWALFNYRTYLALSFLDDHVFTRVVPDRFFYNLILHARKPGRTA